MNVGVAEAEIVTPSACAAFIPLKVVTAEIDSLVIVEPVNLDKSTVKPAALIASKFKYLAAPVVP